MRSLLVLALLAICWLLPAAAFAKLPKGVEMAVEVGYDNFVQPGRVNPVIVNLKNASADLNISGELVLEYNGVEYASRLELPTPSEKRIFLYFPCDAYSPLLKLRFRSKAYSDEFLLGEPGSFRSANPEDLSMIVLTRASGSLGVMNQQTAARLYRDLYRSDTAGLGSGRIFVSYFDLDEIDPNPKFFSRADIIVLADIDYRQATPDLAEALSAVGSGGASVVFSLGLNGAAVASSALAPLCPLQSTGTREVADLGAFGEHYGIRGGRSSAIFATGATAAGAEVLEWAGSLPAVVRKPLGSGTSTALAFDVTQVPFKQNAQLSSVFRDAVLPIDTNVNVTNWFVHPTRAAAVLQQLAAAKPMTPQFVLLFLLAYVLLVGPLNFVFLDRLKRRTLVWTTIPLIILAFTYLGLYTGYLYRGRSNVVAYFQERHIYQDAAYVPYQTVMLIFTAERTNYNLEVPDRSAFLYPTLPQLAENFGMPGAGGLVQLASAVNKVDSTEEPVVSASQGKWTPEVYTYTGYLPSSGSFTSDVTAIRGEGRLSDIAGTVTLDLPYDLVDCYLTAPELGTGLRLGELAGRGTYDVGQLTSVSQPVRKPLPDDNYLLKNAVTFADLQRQSSSFGQQYTDELLLVGFTLDVGAKADFGRPHTEHTLSMVVLHLPLQSQLKGPWAPVVTRTLLVGGSGFGLANSYMSSQDNRRRYVLEQNGTLTVSNEISGQVNDQTRMQLYINGFNAAKQEEQIQDLTRVLQVEVWDGQRWRIVKFPPGVSPNVPVLQNLTDDRRVIFRFTALSELGLQMPWGDLS